MAIQLSDLKSSFLRYKRDISDVGTAEFVEWCEYLLYFLYERLKRQDSERFLNKQAYAVLTAPDTFAFPTDMMGMRQDGCGFFEIINASLAYDAQSADFTVGAVLTGGTSGATGTITADDDNGTTGTLTIGTISGIFQDNEVITGASGGSATANGEPVYNINLNGSTGYSLYGNTYRDGGRSSSGNLVETSFGSKDQGYYFSGSNIVFTGVKDRNYLQRYVPKSVSLSSIDEYFTLDGTATGVLLVEDRHKEYLLRAIDVYYSQWDEDLSYESIADFRLVRALDEVMQTYKRTPKVYQIDDYTQSA